MASEWIEEFAAEIADDALALRDARTQRAGTAWSFDVAAERTKKFYRERITGYCICGSVTETERDRLLAMVEALAEG
jgi:hypothetical protein